MIVDTEYYIRRKSSSSDEATFEVAKFAGDTEPAAIYTVVVTTKKVTCDCWGYMRHHKPCRHQKMVARWVLNGDKEPEGGNKP